MAWVKLDDSAMDHPKVLLLNDAQFRLWVRGLCYCQKHLTDGRIPNQAIRPLFGRACDVQRLCEIGLWEANNDGFQVHDFLDWNDPRGVVEERREAKDAEKQAHKAKMKRWRELKKGKRDGKCDGSQDRHTVDSVTSHRTVTVPVLTTPHHTLVQKDPPVEALSSPPPRGKQYARIHVFPWQIEELINKLGPHANAFELDAWIYGLSALADSRGLILSTKQAVWAWVQSELMAEVKRRKLPVAGEVSETSDEERIAQFKAAVEEQESWSRRPARHA